MEKYKYNLEELYLFDIVEKKKFANFFVTAQIINFGALNIEKELLHFLTDKHSKIINGINGRKFIFKTDNGWRVVITFFPTNKRVDEKYALKNKVYIKRD